MYNIALVCTAHKEYGNCNSIELQKIIETINPEIIFEELSHAHFDECYYQQSLVTLETSAIKNYLQNHTVKHIPVDTYALPKTYYQDLDRMYKKIFSSNQLIESHNLRALTDSQSLLEYQHGFKYLNSDQNEIFFATFTDLKEQILKVLNDENLFRIYRLEQEMIEKREQEIINNIYSYCKENKFSQALLFIGSGHRNSIIEMIKKMEVHEKIKLNWTPYCS